MDTPPDASIEPKIVVVAEDQLFQTASTLLQETPQNTILSCSLSEAELRKMFSSVDCVFTDADGTGVGEGLTTFPRLYSDYVQRLAHLGITTILITGKPYEEVSAVVASLPRDSPLKVIYEKGAYYLEADSADTMQKHYLLSTPELEASVSELRTLFLEQKAEIEAKYIKHGKPQVTFGWSGSGMHKSMLSIDILTGTSPTNYLKITGTEREDLKIKDPVLLAQVEADLQLFVDTNCPDWKLIHIGNGNSDITPGPIEKDLAILQMTEFQNAKGVLLWGDSGNDSKMFELRSRDNVYAGLVLHREKSIDLIDHVDFVSFGMANALPFFELLTQTH
jgi:hydroxymethylpyrimidine pyrophosphatase-like HAD family hydrolase